MEDKASVLDQIKVIASNDSMIICSERETVTLPTVGEVTFGVNVDKNGFVTLISSTQVDDPVVMSIVKYLNGIYGEAREEDPFSYWWSADGPNDEICALTIRLRPLHSEEGGTAMMFY